MLRLVPVRHVPSWPLVLLALVAMPAATHAQDVAEAELLELNARLLRSQIVERDATLMDEVALAQFHVLAPGGLIENKQQALGGVNSWDVVGIEISGEQVIREGPVAVVMGRLDIDGTMSPVGRLAPLKFMAVFISSDGRWRILSRSLTPCIDRLVQMGRC